MVLGAEREMQLLCLSTLCLPVSTKRLLLVIAAMQKYKVLVRGCFLQQQPLQHLLVGPLATEIILINLELQDVRKKKAFTNLTSAKTLKHTIHFQLHDHVSVSLNVVAYRHKDKLKQHLFLQ